MTKKRNRRSLFQRPLPRTDCSARGRGPQGPRRPRFSFFRFTCQTARDQGDPLPGGPESRRNPTPPTEIGGWSPNISEELRGRAIAPRRRRTVWGVYRPLAHTLSTPGWRKSSRACARAHMPVQCNMVRPPVECEGGNSNGVCGHAQDRARPCTNMVLAPGAALQP